MALSKPLSEISFSFVSDLLPEKLSSVVITEHDYDETLVEKSGRKSCALGIGKETLSRRKQQILFRRVISAAKAARLFEFGIDLTALYKKLGSERDFFEFAYDVVLNLELANYEYVATKTEPKSGWKFIKNITLRVESDDLAQAKKAIAKAQMVARVINEARSLANTPGGDMTPKLLALRAKAMLAGTKATLTVLGKKQMEKFGMGGVLGVGKGSAEEPQFLVMEYRGGTKSEKPIVLVGKGVTFDTGGLNLKPSTGIYEMHMDMSGGAVTIAALSLAAKLGIKKNIIGLVPAVENMPSGSSYRPGDVLRTLGGKTIEVLNTDAEGRIILADALEYAKRYEPRLVIDVATLTGASMVALGQRASAIFTKDETLEKLFRDLGEESGDYVWPLPLWDEYEREVKGTFGDVANLGKSSYGGAINGAMFLYQFVKDSDGKSAFPWVHIDMAPRMTSVDGDYLAKGATAEPTRLLLKLLESF